MFIQIVSGFVAVIAILDFFRMIAFDMQFDVPLTLWETNRTEKVLCILFFILGIIGVFVGNK